jgi:hypothetical protein
MFFCFSTISGYVIGYREVFIYLYCSNLEEISQDSTIQKGEKEFQLTDQHFPLNLRGVGNFSEVRASAVECRPTGTPHLGLGLDAGSMKIQPAQI